MLTRPKPKPKRTSRNKTAHLEPLTATHRPSVILGIDPGSQKFGAAVLRCLPSEAGWVYRWREVQLVKVKGPCFADRLAFIEKELSALLNYWMPDTVVWEASFFHFGTKNANALIQLTKSIGILEGLLPHFPCVQEGYEVQPASSRKALGVSTAKYPLLRARLAEEYPEWESTLQADLCFSDPNHRPLLADDAVSAMVQAHAIRMIREEGRPLAGINREYSRPA